MINYANFKEFNISYEPIIKKFFITSKSNEVKIGGFENASLAIDFAIQRVDTK